jgi:hypothetical protein
MTKLSDIIDFVEKSVIERFQTETYIGKKMNGVNPNSVIALLFEKIQFLEGRVEQLEKDLEHRRSN